MVSVWLNEKELKIIKDALGTLGDGYWTDEEYTDEECEQTEKEVKRIYGKIYGYWYNLFMEEKLE